MATLFRREQETARLDEEMRVSPGAAGQRRTCRAGLAPEEARQASMREFGNPAVLRDEARRGWSWGWLETLARDLRYGARGADAIAGIYADGDCA